MKKILAAILAVTIVFSMSACSKKSDDNIEESVAEIIDEAADKVKDTDDIKDTAKEIDDFIDEAKDSIEKAIPSDGSNEDTSDTTDWKEFLKEYEDWVDDYIELNKKYQANMPDIFCYICISYFFTDSTFQHTLLFHL